MIVIANAFPVLKTSKVLVIPLPKKRSFWTSFYSQPIKASETLAKSVWDHFYQTFSSF